MANTAVNYCVSLFEHVDLTPVSGQPTYESLRLLNQELKTNAMSVHSNLGGGAHGYYGLIVSPN